MGEPVSALLLLLLGVVVVHASGIKSQFEASCYRGCKCDRVQVKCTNLRETSTELFRHILPEIYPDLDTVIVTGNNFGALPPEDIFGQNSRHGRLSLVNLSSNGITAFSSQTFIGASRVEYLSLAHNRIESFADKTPLNYLTSLRLIDLTAAFGDRASANKKADLIRTLFNNNHSFAELYEVNLADNKLHAVKVRGLSRLILTNNHFATLDFKEGCLDGLTSLELRRNRFLSVPASVWKNLPSLSTMDFSTNPLRCDCELQEFHEFALAQENSFLLQPDTVCTMPKHLKGRSIFELEENFCRGRRGFLHWLILLAVAAALLYVYRWFRASGRPLKLNFFKGYTQLHSNEVPPTQPAFV